ncbi:MAG: glycosyltransferase family 2 protein [Actinomycetota bacterium]
MAGRLLSACGSGLRGGLGALGLASATAVAVPATYLATLTALGLARNGSPAVGTTTSTSGREREPRRIAVCVPAHDEEAVIAETVTALTAQDYPHDRFEVHVVADNCSDATVELATRAGATAHDRRAPDEPGKGAALNWLHDRLDGFDAFVIVDADTLVDPDFLAEIDRALDRGHRVVQGFYGVLEPEQSPAVALRYAALAARHHLRPLGRRALGGSCGLFGNGMAFDASVLETRRWSGHLVEDAEFQLELLLDGEIVDYVPSARLAAEMPTSLDESETQHQRWELGRAQIARRFLPELIRLIGRNGPRPRHVYVDAALDQVTPPISALAAANGAVTAVGLASWVAGARSGRLVTAVGLGSIGVLGLHTVAALRSVGAPASMYRALAAAPRLVVWKLGLLKDVSRRPDDVSWTRTQRNADARVP